MPGDQETILLIDLPENKAAIAELIADIRKLDEAAKAVSGINIFGKAGSASEARQQQASMAAGMQQIAELQQKMIELENQLAAAKAKGAGSGKTKTDEDIKAQIAANEARRQSAASIKDQIKYNDAEVDSMVRKRIELKQIKAEYIKLGPEKQAMDSGRAMIAQMRELSDELLKQESSYGQFGRNVGNYSGALKVLEEQLAKTTSKMGEMENRSKTTVQNLGASAPVGFNTNQWKNQNTTSFTGANGQTVSILNEEAAAYQKAGQQAQWLTTIVQKSAGGFASQTQQIRFNEKALISMASAGLEGTEAFEALREETVGTAREMKEFQRQEKLLESEAPALKALTLAAKGLAGAYAIGAGAASLFADGDEKVEKEMNKMIAVMTILQGLHEVWELEQQKGAALKALNTAATTAETVATELFAAVTGEATAAMTALDAAMIMSGIGALIIGLGGLIYLISNASESTKEYYEAQGKLNEQLKEYYDAIVKANEALDDELKRQDESAKRQAEVYAVNVRSIEDQEKLSKMKRAIAESDKKRADDVMESLKKEIGSNEELQGEYDVRLDGIKALQKANKEINEQQEFSKQHGGEKDPRLEDDLAGNNTVIELYHKQSDALKIKLDRLKEVTDQQEDSDQALALLNAEDQKFAHELYERKVKALTEISNLLRQQSADYLALQTGNSMPEGTQMKALEAEKVLREQIIISNRDQELRAENLTREERRLIREKANDELFKLDETFIGREAIIRYNARNADVNEEIKTQAELLKLREQFFQRQAEKSQTAFANRKAYEETSRDQLLKSLEEQHTKRDPTGKNVDELRKYNERKLEIETDSNNNILRAEQELTRKQIALAQQKENELKSQTPGTTEGQQKQGKDIADVGQQKNEGIAKYANLELQIEHNTAAEKQKIAQDALDKKLATIDLGAQAEQQAQKTVSAFVQGAYDHQINLIDRQIRKNNELKETESARIQNSTLSDTQRAAASTRLALETDQRNQSLERKKRQVQVREAEFDRDKGILDVGVNTGVGIMKAVAEFPETGGMPWVAIIAAMGAAQLAAILAKPIPKFETGTDFSPEGLAMVHPGEMRIDPSGKISMTPDEPSYTYLDRGTKIIPRHKTDMMNDILLASILSDSRPVQDNRVHTEIADMKNSLMQAMRDQTAAIKRQKPSETHVHIDSNFLTYIKTCQ